MQLVVPRRRDFVNGAFRASAVPSSLACFDESATHQKIDHSVERAVAQLDAVLLVSLPEDNAHLVGVHRPLEQKREHCKRQWIRWVRCLCHGYTRSRVFVCEYTYTITVSSAAGQGTFRETMAK